MTEPSLSLQKAIRDRLTGDSTVTGLVPAASIFDRSRRPEVFPCCIMGEGQTIRLPDTIARTRIRCAVDLHIWANEEGTTATKTIAGAVFTALQAPFYSVDEYHVIDFRVASTKFMRDPGGQHSHGLVSIEALLEATP